jgi:hypothetical protein
MRGRSSVWGALTFAVAMAFAACSSGNPPPDGSVMGGVPPGSKTSASSTGGATGEGGSSSTGGRVGQTGLGGIFGGGGIGAAGTFGLGIGGMTSTSLCAGPGESCQPSPCCAGLFCCTNAATHTCFQNCGP